MALALALIGLGGAALAQGSARQTTPSLRPPHPARAQRRCAEPQPDETNAQRASTQPGNNAPFWRGVRNSGTTPGSVNNLQVGEKGVLVQEFTQYPGSLLTTAGEAWRAGPQLVDHSVRRRRSS